MNFNNSNNNNLNIYHEILIQLLDIFQLNKKTITLNEYLCLLEECLKQLEDTIDQDVFDIEQDIIKTVNSEEFNLSTELIQEVDEQIEKINNNSDFNDLDDYYKIIIKEFNELIDSIRENDIN